MSDHFHQGLHWSCESIDKRLRSFEERNAKLEEVARAAEALVVHCIHKPEGWDGLAKALAALHAPTEGKEKA